jgi:hypothetical protein
MNRILFWITTVLSSLVLVLLVANIFLKREVIYNQNLFAQRQQDFSRGQAYYNNYQRLGVYIIQVAQKTGDSGLKELIIRQSLIPPSTDNGSSSGSSSSSSSPSSTPSYSTPSTGGTSSTGTH